MSLLHFSRRTKSYPIYTKYSIGNTKYTISNTEYTIPKTYMPHQIHQICKWLFCSVCCEFVLFRANISGACRLYISSTCICEKQMKSHQFERPRLFLLLGSHLDPLVSQLQQNFSWIDVEDKSGKVGHRKD